MNRDDASILIRPLREADAGAYRAMRLAALAESPQSFGASVEEEERLDDAGMAALVAPPPPGVTFGAFHGGRLTGSAAYVPSRRLKQRHRAMMVAVYVEPAFRGSGAGRRLVEAVIGHARRQRVILACTVVVDNAGARALYRRLGFEPYGLDRHALHVDGRYLDEELLALDLREG